MQLEKLPLNIDPNTYLGYTGPGRSESPIEAIFKREVEKYLSPRVKLVQQLEVAPFRLDFAITSDFRTIGIECDGKEFHQNRLKDSDRDEKIISSGKIGAIYRITGSDIFNCLEDCLLLISRVEPWAFSERGRVNLLALSNRHGEWNCMGGAGSALRFKTPDHPGIPVRCIYVTWVGTEHTRFKEPDFSQLGSD